MLKIWRKRCFQNPIFPKLNVIILIKKCNICRTSNYLTYAYIFLQCRVSEVLFWKMISEERRKFHSNQAGFVRFLSLLVLHVKTVVQFLYSLHKLVSIKTSYYFFFLSFLRDSMSYQNWISRTRETREYNAINFALKWSTI